MPRYTGEQKAEMVRLYQDGHTSESICKQFGCSIATVSTALKAAGVAPRRGPGSVRQEQGRTQREMRTHRTCNVCGEVKPVDEFYPGQGNLCKECSKARVNEWAKEARKNGGEKHERLKERNRINAAVRRYGITREEAERLYSEGHGHTCHICGADPDPGRRILNIDHDHETGKVRGLLCSPCNRALGLFQDDADVLREAIKYLERVAA